jgi:predicted RNA polymerase sigma factor
MPESAWLIMVGLNDTIDKMVTSTTDKMRQTDFKKITEGGNFHGL